MRDLWCDPRTGLRRCQNTSQWHDHAAYDEGRKLAVLRPSSPADTRVARTTRSRLARSQPSGIRRQPARARKQLEAAIGLNSEGTDAAGAPDPRIQILAVLAERHVTGVVAGHAGAAIGVEQFQAAITADAEARDRATGGIGGVG